MTIFRLLPNGYTPSIPAEEFANTRDALALIGSDVYSAFCKTPVVLSKPNDLFTSRLTPNQ